MSKRRDIDLVRDIKESMERVVSFTYEMEYVDFSQDYKTQDAVIRNIEIMGEAVKVLSEKVKKDNSYLPWKSIAGTRDKLIHHYFGVNIDIVWNLAKEEIPELLHGINNILKELDKENG